MKQRRLFYEGASAFFASYELVLEYSLFQYMNFSL